MPAAAGARRARAGERGGLRLSRHCAAVLASGPRPSERDILLSLGRMSTGMKLLLLASVLVIVLTGSGSGSGSGAIARAGPRTTGVGVRAIAAERERAAFREAESLLRKFVAPPGARATKRPPGYGSVRVLRRSGSGWVTEVADLHRFWTVRKPLKAVAAFVRAHRLHGFGHFGGMWYTGKPHYLVMGSSWPAAIDSVPRRYFTVTLVELPHVTVMRADAGVVWIYPRSPSERVPSGVRMIDIHVPRPSHPRIAHLIDRARVARIIRWFDALPISPPGVRLPCLGGVPAAVTLAFRNAHGRVVAQAKFPGDGPNACDSIGFKIGRHRQTPLIDRPGRASFTTRLQVLLGLQLIPTHR